MRDLVRKHLKFFLLTSLAALALRLLFVFKFPAIVSDSAVYADIAVNWLQHSAYAFTDGTQIVATDIRLPGYPAFLAIIFSIFGANHYRAVLLLQVLVDIGTCFLTADLARRLISDRVAKAAFLLTALCPFLANYSAAVLTETLEVFFTVLALDLAVIGLLELQQAPQLRMRALRVWSSCGLAIAGAILLRPDGGLLLIALELYFAWIFLRSLRFHSSAWQIARAAILTGIFALLPLLPWTLRNFHTLHEFQPLAPRYATDQDEFIPAGFNRWVKTWIADYDSVEEVYWNVPGDAIEVQKLPSRAFDFPSQHAKTEEILNDYNLAKTISPQLDARFFSLAQRRIHDHPVRYYVWLPVLRITDMWLRPRTELLPPDVRWWEFNDDPVWSAMTVILGILGLTYVIAGFIGLLRTGLLHSGSLRGGVACPLTFLLLFCIVRSVFLGTLENPEPRYMLEMYPVVILFFSYCFAGRTIVTRNLKMTADNLSAPTTKR